MAISTVPFSTAAAACAIAALPHFACLSWGANGHRCLGAGTKVAKAVALGDWRPHASAMGAGASLLSGRVGAPGLLFLAGAVLSRK